MRLESISKSKAHAEKCPTCGGQVRRRPYGEMYAGAFIQDRQRLEIRRIPDTGFIDPIVLDPLTQYFDGGLYRLWPSDKYYSRGGKKLHRDVWRIAFGQIPAGCHIHHKDGNPANNLLANLECLPSSEHLSKTWHEGPKAKQTEHFSDLARERAAEWHKSEAGRLWHRRHADRIKAWTKWKRVPKKCPVCKKEFACLVRKSGAAQKYCSEKCKVLAYRKRKR